jgi:hypothetical protein
MLIFCAMNSLFLRLVAAVLLGIWLILLLIGKSGMIHVLLLCGITFIFVEIVCVYRKNLEQH